MGRKPKQKFPTDETMCIDYCQCIECGHKFNGHHAINNNLDSGTVACPECETVMNVYMSVEYICNKIED